LLKDASYFINLYRKDNKFLEKDTFDVKFSILDYRGNLLANNNFYYKSYFPNPLQYKLENRYVDSMGNRILITSTGIDRNRIYIIISKPSLYIIRFRTFLILSFTIVSLLIYIIYWNSSTYLEDQIIIPINSVINFSKRFTRRNISDRIETDSDLVEINELYEKFNTLLTEMENSFRTIEDFSSNVSHELRTPITSMKQSIEVELTKERSTEEYIETLIKVLEDVNWINSIINDMLLLTNLSADKEILYYEHVNIKDIIIDICEMMEFLAMENDVNLEYSSLNKISVYCDKNKIKRLLVNLISNAVKYNKKNGNIYVYTYITKNKIAINIKDTGIGIKKENVNKITEKFFREDKARTSKKSGVGLGLAISKHIVELHQGSLIINSVEGEGSLFTILLPINGGNNGLL
jgi:signal transduction histidine kinase